MPIFNIEITETLRRTVPIKAQSEAEAIGKAHARYEEQQIVLGADDFVEYEIVPANCDHLDGTGECYPAGTTCPDCGTEIAAWPED